MWGHMSSKCHPPSPVTDCGPENSPTCHVWENFISHLSFGHNTFLCLPVSVQTVLEKGNHPLGFPLSSPCIWEESKTQAAFRVSASPPQPLGPVPWTCVQEAVTLLHSLRKWTGSSDTHQGGVLVSWMLTVGCGRIPAPTHTPPPPPRICLLTRPTDDSYRHQSSTLLKPRAGPGEMAQQVEVLAGKLDNLSGQNWTPPKLSSVLRMHTLSPVNEWT